MDVSEFTLKLVLLFLPGVIAYLVVENLVALKTRKDLYFFVYSLLLGFVSYSSYAALLKLASLIPLFNVSSTHVQFLDALVDANVDVSMAETFVVSVIAVFMGTLFSFIINGDYFFKLTQKLHLTRQTGGLSVWSELFFSQDGPEWVVVRDIEHDLVYEGWVQASSDAVDESELLLRDVIVFENGTGTELYSVPTLYIARNRDQSTIEFPNHEFSPAFPRELEETPKEVSDDG